MNPYIYTNISKNNIENFSLLKDKKKPIFGIYKTIRYKNINQNTLISIIPRNDIFISKEINLNYEEPIRRTNSFNEKSNTFLNTKNLNVLNCSSLTEKIYKGNTKIKNIHKKFKKIQKNYCKKGIPIENNKKNVLIRPIMFEDIIFPNKKDCSAFKESPKKGKENNNNLIYNQTLYNNNKNTFSLNNNFHFNIPILTNSYNFKNAYLNNGKTFGFNLNAPIFPEKVKNFNQNYIKLNNNENNELNKLKYNNFEITNKANNLSDIFKIEKKNISLQEKNISLSVENSINKDFSINNIIKKGKMHLKNINKSKGRKAKNSQNINIESKHTKHSVDNMMRKIKNKVIESSRLLINKVFNNEINNTPNLNYNLIYKEFRKIQGSFSQELNIKFNFWFYQIKIKDIFTLEISNKYTAIEKSSNKELIDYLYSPLNENRFIKTKQLLNTPFHQYYHNIFLNEDINWKKYYGINENDNRYQIDNLLKNLEIEGKGESYEKNKDYINDINKLAHNYEDYFLEKKPRKVDFSNKKNQFVKNFMNNCTLNDKYLKLLEEVKQIKNYYDNRNIFKDKFNQIILTNQKSEETMDNSFIKNNNNYINVNNKEKSIIENNNDIITKINNNNNFNNFIELKNNILDNKDNNTKENKNNSNINSKNENFSDIFICKESNIMVKKENKFCNRKRKIDVNN